jgi:colicin import membrane protein
MKNEVVKIDPKINEVVQSSGLEVSKAVKYAEPYAPLLGQITEIAEQVKGLDKNNPEHVAIAKRASLDLGKICSQAEQVKKSDKAELLIVTRYLDGLFNTVNGAGRLTQSEAKEIVNYQENLRLEAIEKTRQERWKKLQDFTEVEPSGLGEMDSTIFDNLLIGMKSTHEAKLEAERKAEEERKEQERLAELARIEREKEIEAQRIENERLKKEAEVKEKALELEREKARKEAERLEAERQAQLKIERDKQAKLEAELQAKKDAEIKAEKERLAEIEKQRKEAERLAKAPIKKRLSTWVNSMEIGNAPADNETSKEIIAKFNSFKKWALSQVESL